MHLMTWVTPDVKRRFTAAAQARGFSESALLRYLVDTAIVGIAGTDTGESLAVEPLPACASPKADLQKPIFFFWRETKCFGDDAVGLRRQSAFDFLEQIDGTGP